MENFQEINQFIELTIARQDDKQDYEKILTMVTTLCYTMLDNFHRKILLHRRFLNNLTIILYQKQRQQRARLENTPELNCKCENCVVSKILNNETEVKKLIRIPLIIFHKLRELIKPDNIAKYDLITFLIWLAKGCNYNQILNYCRYKNVTDLMNCIDKTLTALLNLSPHLIKLPQKDYELQNIGVNFAGIAGHTAFASLVGAIDTWIIKINEDYQINKYRELVSSLYFQAVCNHQGLIIDINVDFGQNMSKTEILRKSSIYHQKLYPPHNYFIAGNYNLPCILRPISILTPYPLPMNSANEAQFNFYHTRLTSVTDKTFTKMYYRWEELFAYPLNLSEISSTRVVRACAIIHNACLLFDDSETDSVNADIDFSNYCNLKEAPDYEENEVDCEDVRDFIARQLPKPMIILLPLPKTLS